MAERKETTEDDPYNEFLWGGDFDDKQEAELERKNTKRIILEGPFTEGDIHEIAALLRRIDERNPRAIFRMEFANPEMSADDAEAMLRRVLPPLPDRATDFARLSYRDDSYPERLCDHCQEPYRGPAVYCSLECAIADA